MNRPALFICITFLLSVFSFALHAQEDTFFHHYPYPQAILVQLSSQQSRLKHLKPGSKAYNRIAQEGEKINGVTMLDFKDHYSFCPVYFYMDTDIYKIKAKQFAGVVFDTNGIALTAPRFSSYYIVYFGYPEDDKHSHFAVREANYRYGNGLTMGRGLVVEDGDMVQTHQPFPYFICKLDYWDLFKGPKVKAYSYESKKYDMEYYPLAKELSEEFKEFFDEHRRIIPGYPR